MASNVLNFNVSQTKGSDEIQEMFCEECDKHVSKYVSAEGFCMDCVEYKCDICIMYHRRHFPDHRLQDKESMPQEFCLERCSVHSSELIKFYCETCDRIACWECRKHDHQTCLTIKHLPTLVQGVKQSKELKDLLEDMDNLSEDLENTEKELQTNTEYISIQENSEKINISNHIATLKTSFSKEQKEVIDKFDKKIEETIAKLKKERQELVEQLAEKKRNFEEKVDKAEADVRKKIESSKETDQTNLDSLMQKALALIDELKASSKDLELKQRLGQDCETFIAMKTVKENIISNAKKAKELKETNKIHFYNINLAQTNQTLKTMENTVGFFTYEVIPKSRKERTATFHSDIETQYSGLHSSCLLSPNTLIISYYGAKSVVIFNDIMQNKPSLIKLKMSSRPWAIAKAEINKVAVTYPDEGIVHLMTFSETMTVTEVDDIQVGAGCCGIACINNNLIISYGNHGKVKILDMSGKVLKSFDKDSNGQPMFSNPNYLTLSPDNTTIYVSNWGGDNVTSLTFDGKVKAIYKDDQLKRPSQLTVDESGAVFVCGYGSDNVHQLSSDSDLTKVKVIMDKTDGMARPMSAVYCQYNKRLYVGLFNSKITKAFNVSLK